jgi:hypothetical protein
MAAAVAASAMMARLATPATAADPAGASSPAAPEIVSQIHNAPQWVAGTSYKPGDRVVDLNQKPAGAYECVAGGTAAAPAPAGAAAIVKDGGGVAWKYLSAVDYTSITAWLYDAPAWKSGASYLFRDYVTTGSPLCCYRCEKPGPGPSTLAPVDGSGKPVRLQPAPADGYEWEKVATIGFTSGKNHIPTQKYVDGPGHAAVVQMKQSYAAQLWNDAEYVAGERGENHPLDFQDHQTYYPNDTGPTAADSTLRIQLTAAPGESFMDRPGAPLRYDRANGVAIRNPSGGTAAWGRSPGDAILLHDSCVTLDRLQIKSDTARGVGDVANHDNSVVLSNCIVQSDASGDVPVVEIDAGSTLDNCLVIGSGRAGVWSKYPMVIHGCTIVSQKPAPDSIGILPLIPWLKSFNEGMTVVSDTAVFGWASAAGHGDHKYSPQWWNPRCAGNATDTSDSSDHHVTKFAGNSITIDPLPGTGNHFKVPFDKTTFVDPGSDWRIAPTSPLHGIGMSADRPAHVGMHDLWGK